MAEIEHNQNWFSIKNPVIEIGDYAVETTSVGGQTVRTGLTKQGNGKPWKTIQYSTVNFNSEGKALSAGAISLGGQVLRPLTLISGAIDGTNTIFTFSGKPVQINSNTRYLTEGNGFTITGINQATLTVAPYTGEIVSATG